MCNCLSMCHTLNVKIICDAHGQIPKTCMDHSPHERSHRALPPAPHAGSESLSKLEATLLCQLPDGGWIRGGFDVEGANHERQVRGTATGEHRHRGQMVWYKKNGDQFSVVRLYQCCQGCANETSKQNGKEKGKKRGTRKALEKETCMDISLPLPVPGGMTKQIPGRRHPSAAAGPRAPCPRSPRAPPRGAEGRGCGSAPEGGEDAGETGGGTPPLKMVHSPGLC